MLNINYPPFMHGFVKSRTSKFMCDHLCNKWKDFVNRKVIINKLLDEYVENKFKKKKNDIVVDQQIDKTHLLEKDVYMIDINIFENKYNEIVNLHNECIDYIEKTIVHILKSPDIFANLYSDEELRKIHEELITIANDGSFEKRKLIEISTHKYKVSEVIVKVIEDLLELVEEIIVDILKLENSLKKIEYFKFDLYEEVVSKNMIGGGKLKEIKSKINKIIKKLKIISDGHSIQNPEILKNHTTFKNIEEAVKMLDKLNLQFSHKSRFKQFEIEFDNINNFQNIVPNLAKELNNLHDNFKINFNYDEITRSNETFLLIDQKIKFFESLNKKINKTIFKLKTDSKTFYEKINVKYNTSDIKFVDTTENAVFFDEFNTLKSNIDKLVKHKEFLNNFIYVISGTNENVTKLLKVFDDINKKYFKNFYKCNVASFNVFNDIDIENAEKIKISEKLVTLQTELLQLNSLTQEELIGHMNIHTNARNTRDEIMINSYEHIYNNLNQINSVESIENHIKKLTNYIEHLTPAQRMRKLKNLTNVNVGNVVNHLLNYGIVEFLNIYDTKLENSENAHKELIRETNLFLTKEGVKKTTQSKIVEVLEKLKHEMEMPQVKTKKMKIRGINLVEELKIVLNNYLHNEEHVEKLMNGGIIGILTRYVDKKKVLYEKIKILENTTILELEELETLFVLFKTTYKRVKEENMFFSHILQYTEIDYDKTDLAISESDVAINLLAKINLELERNEKRARELEILLKEDIVLKDLFIEKIAMYEAEINAKYKNISEKILVLNEFLGDDKIVFEQTGGDQKIIEGITNSSTVQLTTLNKTILLSNEIVLFKKNVDVYLNILIEKIKKNIMLINDYKYIINLFNRIILSSYLIPKSIGHDKFIEIAEIIESIVKKTPLLLRMKSLCDFIKNNYNEKQLSISIEESNQMYIDLIILLDVCNNYKFL